MRAFWRGSSPLTRGKLHEQGDDQRPVRLIPTHAGKTRPRQPGRACLPAHPHSRGENPGKSDVLTSADGSSPLTRGKRDGGDPSAERRRLIPTHAGKTLSDLRFYRADRSDLGKP